MKKKRLPVLLAAGLLALLLPTQARAAGTGEAGDYIITLTSDIEETMQELGVENALPVGEKIWVEVWLAGKDASVTSYNAYDMSFSYDKNKLKYREAVLAEQSATLDINENTGTVRIKGCGEAKETSRIPVVSLCFETMRETGSGETATVELTSVIADHTDNAGIQDAPPAEKVEGKDTAQTPVQNYKVIVDKDAPIKIGQLIVDGTEDVTFELTAKDTEFIRYQVKVSVGGRDVTESIVPPSHDRPYYTIPHRIIQAQKGKIEIGVETVYKEFEVNIRSKLVTGEKKAIYNTPYPFRLNREAGYIYTLEVTIGGKVYTDYTVEGNTYTIPGMDVVGDIVIKVQRQKDTSNQTTVTFAGTGSKDGSGKKKTEKGHEYFFSIRRKTGYTYSVTVFVAGRRVPYSYDAELDTYYVDGEHVTGEMVIVIGKIPLIDVKEYVNLEGRSIYLIIYNGPVEEGQAPRYDGRSMYWSEKYNAYVWLVESEKTDKEVKKTVETMIALKDGESGGMVDYSGDVDRNGRIDIADAKLVQQMYEGRRSLQNTDMLTLLGADVQPGRVISMQDVAVIVNIILTEGGDTAK